MPENCQPSLPAGSAPAWCTVLLPPEIDIANADSVRKDLLTAIGRGSALVIADLSRTSFCDCAGVSALMTAGGQAARSGSELRVVARSRPVLRTFELTGLSQCVRVYASGAEATRDPGPGNEGRRPGRGRS